MILVTWYHFVVQELLVEIRRRRATFDTLENCKVFGPVTIEYAKVQAKVNLKYDSWHKEVLSKFGQLIGQVCNTIYLKYKCFLLRIHVMKTIPVSVFFTKLFLAASKNW